MGFFKSIANIVAPVARVVGVAVSGPVGAIATTAQAIPAIAARTQTLPVVSTVLKGGQVVQNLGGTAADIVGGKKVNVAGQIVDYGKGAAIVGATVLGGPALGIGNAGYAGAAVAADKLVNGGGISTAAALELGGASAAGALGIDTGMLQDYGQFFQQKPAAPVAFLPLPSAGGDVGYETVAAAPPPKISKTAWIIGGGFFVAACFVWLIRRRKR